MVHFDLKLADSLSTLLDSASNLGEEVYRRRLSFSEDVDVICGHSLLGNQDLFGSIDDEVASRVIRTFVQIVEVVVL